MVDVLNELHIDAACIGNHDFGSFWLIYNACLKLSVYILDFGTDHLIELISLTNFPWLLSNVLDVDSGKPLANGKIKHIIENNGIRVSDFNCNILKN